MRRMSENLIKLNEPEFVLLLAKSKHAISLRHKLPENRWQGCLKRAQN